MNEQNKESQTGQSAGKPPAEGDQADQAGQEQKAGENAPGESSESAEPKSK
jgi:hypothetical protein